MVIPVNKSFTTYVLFRFLKRINRAANFSQADLLNPPKNRMLVTVKIHIDFYTNAIEF